MVIHYTLDGLQHSFPVTGGPGYEMPAHYVDEYIACLTRRIAESGDIASFVVEVWPRVQAREVAPSETMRQELAIIGAQVQGSRGAKTGWLYTSIDDWWRYLRLDEGDVFGYWRLPLKEMPPDVDAWLDPVLGSQPPDARLPDLSESDAEIRGCVVVTGLHDRLPGVRKISAGIWADELLRTAIGRLEHGQDRGLSETFLKCTWNEVKADPQDPERKLNARERAGDTAVVDEPLSKPMPKSQIMRALGIDGRKRFATWAKGKLIQVGNNRQLWQVRLNSCAANERAKIERA